MKPEDLHVEVERLRARLARLETPAAGVRAAPALMETILHGSPIPHFVIDRRHRVIFWNNSLVRETGIPAEQVLGTSRHWRAFYPKKRPCLADLVLEGAVDEIPRWFSGEWRQCPLLDDAYEAAEYFPDRGQGARWLLFAAGAIRDARGEVAGAVQAIRDITRRKQTEEAFAAGNRLLLAERNRARHYLDIAGVILVAIDVDQKVMLINQKGCEVLGLPQERIIGANWFERFVPARLMKRLQEVFGQLVSGRLDPGEYFENPVLTASGEERTIAWHNSLLRDEKGRIVGTLSSGEDITLRKRAEAELDRYRNHLEDLVKARTAELEAVNRELEAFSYSVSHDLRAPLRAMDGFSQAVLEDYADRLDERGRDYLARVRAASQRMGELIDGLLRLSRITQAEMHNEPVDLSALAAHAIEELRQSQPEREVQVLIAPGLGARGDPRLLRVLLTNLLGNAWKFTGRTPGARIEFGAQARDGLRVFFVRDNGAGFDMAYADKLFGAFQRLHGEAEFEGTGIGLATAQRIVRRHGGRIWCEARPGEGAVFFFEFGPEQGA